MANTMDWVEIWTRGGQAAALFYEALFGWKVLERETAHGLDYWILDTGDEPRTETLRRVGLRVAPDEEALRVVVYVLVEDIDATLERVEELGGEVVMPKTREGDALKAYVKDPEGHVFGLWQE